MCVCILSQVVVVDATPVTDEVTGLQYCILELSADRLDNIKIFRLD